MRGCLNFCSLYVLGTEKRQFARYLRQKATTSETRLWAALRNRQLDGLKFRRQAPRGSYVVDFLCAEKKLVIEVDGATHGTDAERRHDAERTAFLEELGFRVIRFWNDDLDRDLDMVLHEIFCACRENPRGMAG